jgi:TPR repeat protein
MGLAAAAVAVLSIAPALGATLDDEIAKAQREVKEGDWTQAIDDWRLLYNKGVAEAPAQLCMLYFDARQGAFEADRVADWCRRAAARNDAWSLYRMGALYLAGLGIAQNVDQAQAYCAAAIARDKAVPAAYCLAAAQKQHNEAAQAQLRLPQPRPPAPASPVKPDGTPEENCSRAFTASPFDAASVTVWCGKAAAAGDPEAQYRLALVKLTGLDGTPDLDAAELDCRRADASAKVHTPTAFCLAAVAQLRNAAASAALSRQTGAIDIDPTTGQALPKLGGNPFAVDQLLDLPHTTATGLAFTCRQLIQWAQYETPGLSILNPGDTVFGRRLVDYRPEDFTALDRAAVDCAAATKPLDADGSLARSFAALRNSLPALENRQAGLLQAQRANQADAAQIAAVDRTYRTSHVALSSYSTQESACIERVKRSWPPGQQSNGQRALEIGGSSRTSENGRTVAYGTATIVDTATPQRATVAVSQYRCTFDNATGEIASFQLSPGFAATR